MKQKPMLDSIEKILYESRPSPNEKKRPLFKEIYTQREFEYKALVSMFIQKLLDQDDRQLISDIKLFLENNTTLNTGNKVFIYIQGIHYRQGTKNQRNPL